MLNRVRASVDVNIRYLSIITGRPKLELWKPLSVNPFRKGASSLGGDEVGGLALIRERRV